MFASLITHITRPLAIAAGAGMLALGSASGAAAAATAHSAQVTIPPIHETFSQGNCPKNATTTVALETCAGNKVLALDKKIDTLDTKILKLLPAAGQKTFATAAKQWLTYRKSVAVAAASPNQGGTIAPLVELGALQSEDQAHITALTKEFTSVSGQKP